MIKKLFIKIACVFAFLVFATSCLDLDPIDSVGDNLVWTSADNFELFANQFYGYTRDFCMSTSYTTGNGFSDGPHSDFRSDIIGGTSINTYSQGTNTIPTSDPNYSTTYKRIYYTNLLLKNAELYSDPSEIAVSVAEAKFFRAYLHVMIEVLLLTKSLKISMKQHLLSL
jgi:hypothetical protein